MAQLSRWRVSTEPVGMLKQQELIPHGAVRLPMAPAAPKLKSSGFEYREKRESQPSEEAAALANILESLEGSNHPLVTNQWALKK